jgi:protein-L-isoaspartate(D-aspartate) O-methyltransferase
MPPEDEQTSRRRAMVETQLRGRDIVDERVLRAMAAVPRDRFVGEREQRRAYDDAALPISGGQTISQPYMVARICEALRLTGGESTLPKATNAATHAAE